MNGFSRKILFSLLIVVSFQGFAFAETPKRSMKLYNNFRMQDQNQKEKKVIHCTPDKILEKRVEHKKPK